MNETREGYQLRSFVDQTINGVRSWFGFSSRRGANAVGIFTGRIVNGITTSSGNGSNFGSFYNRDHTNGPYVGKYDCDKSLITIKGLGVNQSVSMQVVNAECQQFTNQWQLFYGIDGEVGPELRFFYLRIWKHGRLVRDFIPVEKDGVGMLYDAVSRRLFKSQGSGQFVCGPVDYQR